MTNERALKIREQNAFHPSPRTPQKKDVYTTGVPSKRLQRLPVRQPAAVTDRYKFYPPDGRVRQPLVRLVVSVHTSRRHGVQHLKGWK